MSFEAGFGRACITPEKGLPLAGYFNPRFNVGKLDDLYARAVVLQQGTENLALVSCDLCYVTKEIVTDVRRELETTAAAAFAEHLLLCATHTHTAPYPSEFFGYPADPAYLAFLAKQIAAAVVAAAADLAPAELAVQSGFENPFAFNRRYWMKNGTVVTNPGKCNPDIVMPEGPVDREITVVAIRRQGQVAAVLANIVNHTDTTGGDLVSADWVGHMEKMVQTQLQRPVSVLALIGCSGNVNHFDVSDSFDQTTPAEAKRIGDGYGKIVADLVRRAEPLAFAKMQVKRSMLTVPRRKITAAELAKAQEVMKATEGVSANGDLTSEELAAGNGAVARFFAGQTLNFAEKYSGVDREFEHYAVTFDDALALATVPGECFTEIGMAIKSGSPAKITLPVELAMGECGYVCMPRCYERGGYEILPVSDAGPAADAAPRIVKSVLDLLWKK